MDPGVRERLESLARARKQRLQHEDFLVLWEAARDLAPPARLEEIVAAAVDELLAAAAAGGAAFAWSGGKDSLVLEDLCELAGIRSGVLVLSDLEFPEFLRWATDRMPLGLTVEKRGGVDLPWLTAHPEMLFPRDAATAARWFHLVQHAGQAAYYRREGLAALVVGRRRIDGNYVPEGGAYVAGGIRRLAPIRAWTHADVFSYLQHRELALPPVYAWPRGFRVGTGPWPARQWCRDVNHGWRETYSIDPAVVEAAAASIPSARAFLEASGSIRRYPERSGDAPCAG